VPVELLLTVAGFQVPVIPLMEVVGNSGGTAPVQIAPIGVNIGAVAGSTVMVSITGEAHCPSVGVKV